MFTKIFKSDYIFQFIFFIIISIIIWIKPFMSADVIYSPMNAPLYDIVKWFLDDNPLFKIILSFLLLIGQSILLKVLLSSNDLSPKNSILPSFLYVLLMSSFAGFQNIHPLLFANFFLIVALQIILAAYSKPDSYEQVFNATFLIALGSMFYFPVVFFILFIWLVFLVFSLLKWREWIISLLGFITPYFFLFSFYFLNNTIENKIASYMVFFKKMNFHGSHFTISNFIFLGVLGLFFIFSFFSISSRLSEKSIFYRKKVIVLIMFLIIALLSLLFAKDFFVFSLCLLFIPFSFFFANYILQIKKLIVSEILYLIILGTWICTFLGF